MSVSRSAERLRAEPKAESRIGKAARTRAEIVDAAFAFVWSRPFRDLTVNSLMASTRVSRSAFYQYFRDVHELMEALLVTLEGEILQVAAPWFSGSGDPVGLLDRSLTELVATCYRRGPFLKAVSDAAAADERLEQAWRKFLGRFDDAVSARIAADQALGLISPFDPRPIAITLNRMDAYTFIQAFGQRPRSSPEPVRAAIRRLWIASLYGEQWLETGSSNLVRPDPQDIAS